MSRPSLPIMVDSLPAEFLRALVPISFANAISPPTPIAVCGTATKLARMACSGFNSLPDSKASLRLLPAKGANSVAAAPVIAPAFAVERTPPRYKSHAL